MLHTQTQEWIPDGVWLGVLALSAMDAFRDIPDAVSRSDAAWRAWCRPLLPV